MSKERVGQLRKRLDSYLVASPERVHLVQQFSDSARILGIYRDCSDEEVAQLAANILRVYLEKFLLSLDEVKDAARSQDVDTRRAFAESRLGLREVITEPLSTNQGIDEVYRSYLEDEFFTWNYWGL